MEASYRQAAIAEWRVGWPLVLSAFAGSFLASIYAYSVGVLIAPLEAEFGWSRAQITSGFLVVSCFSVVLSIFMGMVIDRFGPRRLALIGVLVYSAALALLSQATGSLWLWWALWALIATGIMFIKPTVWVTAISSQFDTSRGVALAVVLSASGFVSLAVPMITLLLADNLGWRMAYAVLGIGAGAIVFPLVLFFFHSAKDGARKTKRRSGTAPAPANPAVLTGLTTREGLTSLNFWLLAGAGLSASLVSIALSLNMVPILTTREFDRVAAAGIAGVIGMAQIAGRLAGGYLLDRFNPRLVAAISVVLPIGTSLLLLGAPGSYPMALAAVVLLGFAAGAEMDAIAYLSGKCFGLRSFATLFGAFTGIITLGFGVGPVVASYVYDVTGSYQLVLIGVLPLSLVSAILFLLIRGFPDFAAQTPETVLEEEAAELKPAVAT
ncbi:MFS transporter [Stakelama tenebrarum]|uniref:MFS transporter n=1 Tax=Stakelama tenebrarum TaxID=2711215 RepID=A0A6G6Y7R4_9SPHN|nr:MFS transporter [Sphingosinithalassobacter tenebrarum]QIG80982.1 MFS transporter [Sphingosinithalassobacter tenebrarum]